MPFAEAASTLADRIEPSIDAASEIAVAHAQNRLRDRFQFVEAFKACKEAL